MIIRLKDELEMMKKQNKELTKQNSDLKKLVIEQNNWMSLEACRFETKFKDTLSTMFSPQQINLILHRKKKSIQMGTKRYCICYYFEKYISENL